MGVYSRQRPILAFTPISGTRSNATNYVLDGEQHTDHYIVDQSAPEWILVGDRSQVQPWWMNEFLDLRFGGAETEEVARVYELPPCCPCSCRLPCW